MLVRDVAGCAFLKDGSARPEFAYLLREVNAGEVSPGDASQRILEQV